MLIIRKFLHDIPAAVGLLIVFMVCVVAAFGPMFVPYPDDAFAINVLSRLQPPSAEHIFGTDNLGRDVFTRVILGTRSALITGLIVVIAALLIGVTLGLIAGYSNSVPSHVIMRVTDVFLSIPQLLLALAIAQLLGAGKASAMIALTAAYWPFFARIVYADTRRLKSSLFVDALHSLGAGRWRIMFLHILPNSLSSIIVRATVGLGFTILVAATLAFLGIGAAPPDPDWGLAIAQARLYLPTAWWFSLFPGIAIFLTVLGFNLIGDGLRDLVDPRLRRSR
ncbi:ABC transporter permease [Comamonadaceae bacterium G21597-S1]|nr:ABC transporter permease [Comamonadaceae bacterium G21597-S1]